MPENNTKAQISAMINNLAPTKAPASNPAPQPPAAPQPGQPAKATAQPKTNPTPPTNPTPAPASAQPPAVPNPAAYTPEQLARMGQPANPQPANPTNPTNPANPVNPNPAPIADPAMQMLMAQMQQQQQLIASLQQQVSAAQPKPGEAKVAPPAIDQLLTQEEMQSMFKEDGTIDSTKMYTALTLMGQRSYQLAREHTLLEMPEIIGNTAKREAAIASTVSAFWQQNSDLSAVRQQVAHEADKIVAQNPHLPLESVLAQAAGTVRTALASYQQAFNIQNNPAQSAAFVPANSGGQRVDGADNRSSLQQGIDAMLNSMT